MNYKTTLLAFLLLSPMFVLLAADVPKAPDAKPNIVFNDDCSDRFELYDLKNDLGESKNLAADKPELVRELNDLINGFLKDTGAVVPVRNPNYGKAGAATPRPKNKGK